MRRSGHLCDIRAGYNGDLGTVVYTVLVDIRHDLHVPGWCLQRHDYEGNSWKTTEAQAGGLVCARWGVYRLAVALLAGSGRQLY